MIGVMTMKMISSTIMMSAIGATLTSAIAPCLRPATFIAIGQRSLPALPLGGEGWGEGVTIAPHLIRN